MYELPKEIKEKAEKCKSRHFCLASPKEVLCEVEFLLNDSILFVDKIKKRDCEYHVPFGKTGVCNCPARKELYKLFKI
ncbi:MAG: hypothetical protein PHN57_06160 [Candidatus Omnitrophica bacterium]|nr:hypothetical protein [Candidatus Omnitrophota bacterium]